MRSASSFLALWGLLLAIAVLVAAFIFPHGFFPTALLGGAAAAAFLIGLITAASRTGDPRRVAHGSPDISPATVWLAAAIALACLGAEVGYWLCLIAAGMVGVGAGALLREVRAERRDVRRVR
jgi:membrane-bound ClpP family serine protease